MCEIISSHKEQSYTGLCDASQQKIPWGIRITQMSNTHTPDDSFPTLAKKPKTKRTSAACLLSTLPKHVNAGSDKIESLGELNGGKWRKVVSNTKPLSPFILTEEHLP